MLAVSPQVRSTRDEGQGETESFNSVEASSIDEFADLSDTSLLESINFDDLFAGISGVDDMLPELEMDTCDMFVEFSSSGEEESLVENCGSKGDDNKEKIIDDMKVSTKKEQVEEKSDSTTDEKGGAVNPLAKDGGGKGRKSSSQSKSNPQGKRKVKVDWTPELHRRFVQAVEQLGMEKAVPSRILEIMGIDCLTRHNIASHLQKYRSHRKHLLAREAEAANWTQRRQIYGGPKLGAPAMGFPPMHRFRPLHVWGHPSMHTWPKHLPHSLPSLPPPLWTPFAAPPPPNPSSFWHAHHQQRAPNTLTPAGTPCFTQSLTTTGFGSAAVAGIPPHGIGVPSPSPVFDFHPSKESIDTAIGDVISKPWLPLPLGLKAPALDSVLDKLQKQGIPNIPPSCVLE